MSNLLGAVVDYVQSDLMNGPNISRCTTIQLEEFGMVLTPRQVLRDIRLWRSCLLQVSPSLSDGIGFHVEGPVN